MIANAFSEQPVGPFDTLPVIITVHGVIAPGDGGHPAATQFREQGPGPLQGGAGAAWRGVTTVEECVQVDSLRASQAGQAQRRENLFFVTVHAAGRQQAEDVNSAACGHRLVDSVTVGRVAIKAAVLDGLVDTGDVLVDHPARTQAHVTHFGVAHLALGQPDVQAGA